MSRPRFNDRVTHDTMFKKVFFQPCTALCAVTAPPLSIIYYYCHKCHKCHCPLFAGVSSVTVDFPLLSSVTGFMYS